MAVKKKAPAKKKAASKRLATRTTGTAMAASDWEKEVSSDVGAKDDMFKGMGGGMFISTRGGNFTFDGATLTQPLPVIILDSVLENSFYAEDFDPDNPQAPTCYAIGTSPENMAPEDDCPEKQAEICKDCWANKFGSAEKGRGKACKNTVRLALLPCDQIEDPDALAEAEPAMMRLPVTSVKNYHGHYNRITKVLKSKEFGVITLLETEDSERNQFEVTFAVDEKITDPAIGQVILQQREAVKDALVSFPDPNQSADDEGEVRRKQPASKKKAAKKKAAKKPTGRRRF